MPNLAPSLTAASEQRRRHACDSFFAGGANLTRGAFASPPRRPPGCLKTAEVPGPSSQAPRGTGLASHSLQVTWARLCGHLERHELASQRILTVMPNLAPPLKAASEQRRRHACDSSFADGANLTRGRALGTKMRSGRPTAVAWISKGPRHATRNPDALLASTKSAFLQMPRLPRLRCRSQQSSSASPLSLLPSYLMWKNEKDMKPDMNSTCTSRSWHPGKFPATWSTDRNETASPRPPHCAVYGARHLHPTSTSVTPSGPNGKNTRGHKPQRNTS